MKRTILPFLLQAALLTACGEEKPAPVDKQQPASSITPQDLPATAPTVGTPISTFAKSEEQPRQDGEFAEIDWEDLELPGQGLADIVRKYQTQIDAIPEGDPREDAVLEKMQAELNTAPVNPAMNGRKVKLPGFISPLEVDEAKGMVKEFLLVPYFGACIHVPPPPINQTLLVKPQEGKSIGMERTFEPVWVYGTLRTDFAHTNLADAGYRLLEARVEPYTVEMTGSASGKQSQP